MMMASGNYHLRDIALEHGWLTRDYYQAEGGNCCCPECCGHSLPLNHNGGSRRLTYSGENIPISIFVEEQNRVDFARPEYRFA